MRTLQAQIIEELKVRPTIDPKEEIRRSLDFLKAYLVKHPFLKTLVLGISGGQDSTLCGKLCQMAIEELRAETGDQSYRFIAVRLPYGTQADEQDALAAIDFMQADQTMRVNIKEASDPPGATSGTRRSSPRIQAIHQYKSHTLIRTQPCRETIRFSTSSTASTCVSVAA